MVELWDWTPAPGERHESEAHTPGTRELAQVHQGTVAVAVADHVVTLGVGDAVAFPGDAPHADANPGPEPARFSLTVFEPNVGRGPRAEDTHG